MIQQVLPCKPAGNWIGRGGTGILSKALDTGCEFPKWHLNCYTKCPPQDILKLEKSNLIQSLCEFVILVLIKNEINEWVVQHHEKLTVHWKIKVGFLLFTFFFFKQAESQELIQVFYVGSKNWSTWGIIHCFLRSLVGTWIWNRVTRTRKALQYLIQASQVMA